MCRNNPTCLFTHLLSLLERSLSCIRRLDPSSYIQHRLLHCCLLASQARLPGTRRTLSLGDKPLPERCMATSGKRTNHEYSVLFQIVRPVHDFLGIPSSASLCYQVLSTTHVLHTTVPPSETSDKLKLYPEILMASTIDPPFSKYFGMEY